MISYLVIQFRQVMAHPFGTYTVCLFVVFPQQHPACMICPKYDSFCFSISASHVQGGLGSSITNLFVLLAVYRSFLAFISNTTFQNCQSSSFLSFSLCMTLTHPLQLEIPEQVTGLLMVCIVTSSSVLTLLFSPTLTVY